MPVASLLKHHRRNSDRVGFGGYRTAMKLMPGHGVSGAIGSVSSELDPMRSAGPKIFVKIQKDKKNRISKIIPIIPPPFEVVSP